VWHFLPNLFVLCTPTLVGSWSHLHIVLNLKSHWNTSHSQSETEFESESNCNSHCLLQLQMQSLCCAHYTYKYCRIMPTSSAPCCKNNGKTQNWQLSKSVEYLCTHRVCVYPSLSVGNFIKSGQSKYVKSCSCSRRISGGFEGFRGVSTGVPRDEA